MIRPSSSQPAAWILTISLTAGDLPVPFRRMRYFRPDAVVVNVLGASGSMAPAPVGRLGNATLVGLAAGTSEPLLLDEPESGRAITLDSSYSESHVPMKARPG